jgi:hypothetical protein
MEGRSLFGLLCCVFSWFQTFGWKLDCISCISVFCFLFGKIEHHLIQPHQFFLYLFSQLACGKNGYDYKSVKRWTTRRKLGYELIECDKVKWLLHSLIFFSVFTTLALWHAYFWCSTYVQNLLCRSLYLYIKMYIGV